MKQHAPSTKKLQSANKNGQFLHFFTTRGLLLLLLSGYLVFSEINRYWVTIQKLLKSILGNLSIYQPDNLLQLAYLLTQIFFGAMLLACAFMVMIDLILRRFKLCLREKICELSKLNPLTQFKNKTKLLKQELYKIFLVPLIILPFVFYVPLSWNQAQSYTLNILNDLIGFFAGAIVLASCIELLVRRTLLQQSLAMDDQELKNENKNDRSDPLIASRQQAEYRLLLLENMEAKVRNSKVIFINKY